MKTNTDPVILSTNKFPVVGIGASAGGLEAFIKFIKGIPEDSGMAYVLVQHLSPTHVSVLPQILQKVTPIPVLEITDDIRVEPNHIYIIPSNKMLVANDGVLQLSPRSTEKNERNLPIDLFFSSLALVHQSHAIGVVLSGTASDGTLGLKAIKEQGGITFAQDEDSAAFEGMPQSAALAGVVDFILPPQSIPPKILELNQALNTESQKLESKAEYEDVYKHIVALLRIRKGTDFTYYKRTTIDRRIQRRMAFNQKDDLASYLAYLREHKEEQDLLYQDLLIPVTQFFRDPKVFSNLCESVFPHFADKADREPIRLWVAACSTGEEAYSMAICLREYLGENPVQVQIFATDISEPAIAKARSGFYTKPELEGVSEKRLKEFFNKTDGGYRLKKTLRDMCVFATHNFIKDPPFGRIDLVSCRNVLIYMETVLQKKALTTFHYALNPKGFLLLGKSETVGSAPDLFTPVGKNDKLYTRNDVPGRYLHVATQRNEQSVRDQNTTHQPDHNRSDYQKTADDIMLSRYTPAGVVVNESMDIVHFRGRTADFLEQASGKPSHHLLKMTKDALGFELRTLVAKTKKENKLVIKDNIPLVINGVPRNVTIEAMPLPNLAEAHYLILFHDTVAEPPARAVKQTESNPDKDDDFKDRRILELENELALVREDMRSITEDQEAVNEELQSANEELESGSEELQSLNEELESSKEELQSTNEEIVVVNQELTNLNEMVTLQRDYSESIIANIWEPLLVLDRSLRVKTANASFYKTFMVNERETEGLLIYDLGNQQWNIPALRTCLEELLPKQSKITDYKVTHVFPSIGERIMLLNATEIRRDNKEEKLILLSILDVTEKTRLENQEKEFTKKLEQLVQERTRELSDANNELVKINAELEAFTYVASHDLQEPLRKIQTFSNVILKKEKNALSEKGKDYFVRMHDAAKRMHLLIDNLLTYSHTTLSEREFQRTDLNSIVEEIKVELKDDIDEKHAVIEVGQMCEVNLIHFQLRQMMLNLVGNSLKFSRPSVPPRIVINSSNIKYSKANDKNLPIGKHFCHINVTDNGIGFEPEYKEKIFQVFQRLHGKTEFPGTGIGLAIVKKIVDNHNGIINATGEPNKGASFDIYIPTE